ncbi:MAG: hypothetical protein KDB07_03010 [Planctomycetes bacterium]|nr:hypothetical protein [Planctomycetota bacterium]
MGSAYARNHEVSGTGKLRPETLEGLQSLHEQQAQAKQLAEEKALAEEAAQMRRAEDTASDEIDRQARIGAMEAIQAALSDNPWLAAGVRDKQEAAILAIPGNALSISRILMDRAQQLIPIADDLHATMQTIKASEDLLIKRMLRDYVDQLEIYFDTMSDMLRLAVGVDAIGEVPFPPLEDPATNRATVETIKKRLEAVLDLPTPLLAALAINYTWFDLRVKRLLVPSGLKNG